MGGETKVGDGRGNGTKREELRKWEKLKGAGRLEGKQKTGKTEIGK